MIVLLGSTGYIGQQFAAALRERNRPFAAPLRSEVDYTRFETLLQYLRDVRPEFLVNAAGYTGKPNVDACEEHRAETLQGNALFPAAVAHACAVLDIPFGHVSSGCIFSGAKVLTNGQWRIERDLNVPQVQALPEQNPSVLRGFTESDEPNFSFRHPPCSFYSGSKALAEEAIVGLGRNFVWRLRIPFDQFNNPRNYLSKLQNYPKVYQNANSLSHRGDFVRACLELWDRRAPFGIYNVTNPGFVTTRQVVRMIEKILRPARKFEFWADDEEFYRLAARTPRSNCLLDTAKLLAAGVVMRPVHEALEDSLRRWTTPEVKRQTS